MKKFLNIRNILIILIIIVAVVFIYWGRSDNPKNSKAYELFTHFSNYGPEYGTDENNTIMKLHHKDEKKELTVIYATDYDNAREVYSFETIDNTTSRTDHLQLIRVTTKEGMIAYTMDHIGKTYIMFDNMEDEASEFYANWAQEVLNLITNNPYYTKGYEFVNGDLMHYEYFKETNSKFYFNNAGELTYLSTESLNNSFSTSSTENFIFEVTISHDSIEDSFLEIPDDYVKQNIE